MELAESKPPILRFDHVTVSFDGVEALSDFSFEASEGESRVILGAAGSGKTVLLKTALGLVRPDSGKVLVFGRDISRMREQELFGIRSRIGMLFQESALFDSMNIEDNVAYPLLNQKAIQCPPEQVRSRVVEALNFVELGRTLAKFPSELSGGMRRRGGGGRAAADALRFAHGGAGPDYGAHHHRAADQRARSQPDHHPDGDAPLPGRQPDRQFPLQFETGRFGTCQPSGWPHRSNHFHGA
jgi:ABC-type ATPase involved in cell division